jgi:hypothetical protein
MYQRIHTRDEHNTHHKRKRSESSSVSPRPGNSRAYDYSPSKRVEPQHVADRALRAMGNADQNGTGHYTNGHPVDQNGHSWPPHARPIQPHGPVNGSRPTTSDAQLAEALQRETHSQDDQSRNWDTQSSTNGDGSHTPYDHDRDSPNTITVVGPKRKRNFSNRTKTGCMTCRRRKKKCDETHPICEQPLKPNL